MAKSLFDHVEPRRDVLEGVLSDSVFAASLDEVVEGTAPATYGDATAFFNGTYPSAGLRALLDEVLGRLGGGRPDGAPVVRLETNLGGGKTHNLIALYHAARGFLDPMRAMEFMDPALLPSSPIEQIAVFVGTASGATSFPTVANVTPHTVWGYMALQLGGSAAYQLIRQDDEDLTAPGADALRKMMAGRPTLVLIDEIARYLGVAEGKAVAGSTLADQTTAFLMSLMEAVSAEPHAAVVITTTQVTDAFGEETAKVLEAIVAAQSLIARKEHVLHPSDEADLPRIVSRRLFASVDSSAAGTVAAEYASATQEAFSRGTDLPERMAGPAWSTEISRTYPFHPDLMTVLDKRLSTIPNFQRTRGALRLLARAVRLLWETHPDGTQLIHLHHIDLSDKELANDLSSRLDKATFEPVIRADIASQPGSEPSHAEQVDAHMGAPYARRLATTAYLYSLTRDVPGVPAAALVGGVLAPGDDPNVISKALDNLEASAWFLHTDVRGYRFSIEASLAKLTQEAESQITPGRAKQAATDILAGLFRDSALKVRRTWEDAKVPDRDDDAWLVVLHWDEFGGVNGVNDLTMVPTQIKDLWEKTPAGGVREYRNRLVFLAPSASTHETMLRTVRRHLALKELVASGETLKSLSDDKRKELADRAKLSDLEARVAVCNHVNLLYVPQAGGLDTVELDVVTQASLKPNQSDAVLDRLAAMEKTLAAGDKPLDPGWIKSKLGAQLDGPLATIELVRAFARRSDLKLVLDRAQIAALVGAGIRNGVWEYHDAERGDKGWATKDDPTTAIRLADDTTLYPPGSAPAVDGGGGIIILPPPPKTTVGSQFETQGKSDVAIQAARQKAADAGKATVRELHLSIDELGKGTGAELAKLFSVVPTTTSGTTLIYDVRIGATLGDAAHQLQITFVGPPQEFQSLRSALDHVLRQHEATVKVTVAATFEPVIELSGEAFANLQRRAADTGPSKATVSIITEAG
jgi:hypothetical protein